MALPCFGSRLTSVLTCLVEVLLTGGMTLRAALFLHEGLASVLEGSESLLTPLFWRSAYLDAKEVAVKTE